ncbi:hypothetical protein LCGC14_1722730 [marine sediment metagenome]|uniref:Uncharacterized protein n=1 Tax=marine sediment metagenome TaxID=412755 RepID=A0A0F9HC08_9ZZZZ
MGKFSGAPACVTVGELADQLAHIPEQNTIAYVRMRVEGKVWIAPCNLLCSEIDEDGVSRVIYITGPGYSIKVGD